MGPGETAGAAAQAASEAEKEHVYLQEKKQGEVDQANIIEGGRRRRAALQRGAAAKQPKAPVPQQRKPARAAAVARQAVARPRARRPVLVARVHARRRVDANLVARRSRGRARP